MKQIQNSSFRFLLMLFITCSSIVSGGIFYCVSAQNPKSNLPTYSTNRLPLFKDWKIHGIIFLGVTGLAISFVYRNNKNRYYKKTSQFPVGRFQGEFNNSPLADPYTTQLNEPSLSTHQERISSLAEISTFLTEDNQHLKIDSPELITSATETNLEETLPRVEVSTLSTVFLYSQGVRSDEPNSSFSVIQAHSLQSWSERYQDLIERLVDSVLQGKFYSKEHLLTELKLMDEFKDAESEIFERCLQEEINKVEDQINNTSDELKKSRGNRRNRALGTIQEMWTKWQKENQKTEASANAMRQILDVASGERLITLLQILDINQPQSFTHSHISQLAELLANQAELSQDLELVTELNEFGNGLSSGLESLSSLQENVLSWIHDQGYRPMGFESVHGQQGPWAVWAKQVNKPFIKQLFQFKAQNQSVSILAEVQTEINLSILVELVVLLAGVQKILINWFDQQLYSVRWGKYFSCSTLMTFAILWCELSNGFDRAIHLPNKNRQALAHGCFQMILQTLRTFAQRDDFPLYGGIFASFSGENLHHTFEYLDRPLQQLDITKEKGRIMTLLGYSQRILGKHEQAKSFHQDALEIARQVGDSICEVANLNHLARTSIAQKEYQVAIAYSQRALILARQEGDRLGEANGLVNLGHSQVLEANQQEQMQEEFYEQNIEYLKQALSLTERVDRDYVMPYLKAQTEALACNTLGIAYVILGQSQTAVAYLEKGAESACLIGDQYLQGINLAYLAEAYYNCQSLELALYSACLAMYILERISAQEWRQAAGLTSILKGRIGSESFDEFLRQHRSKIVAFIGVDGFDYIPQLLEKYRDPD